MSIPVSTRIRKGVACHVQMRTPAKLCRGCGTRDVYHWTCPTCKKAWCVGCMPDDPNTRFCTWYDCKETVEKQK